MLGLLRTPQWIDNMSKLKEEGKAELWQSPICSLAVACMHFAWLWVAEADCGAGCGADCTPCTWIRYKVDTTARGRVES